MVALSILAEVIGKMANRWVGLVFVAVLVFTGVFGVVADGASGAGTTLTVASAMLGGKSQQILVDAKGMSLYYLTSDTMTSSACTGGCAGSWPPLLSSDAPTAAASVTGKLAVVKTANGSQVSYSGHLLYRFAGDTKPGDVNGDGVQGPQQGTWHVTTPGTKPAGM